MVDPVVDGYTKIINHWKMIQNRHKKNNLLKTKRMLKPKYNLSGRPVFKFSLPGGKFASLQPISYPTGYDILYLHAAQ